MMPIIEGEYEMLADRRQLLDELQRERAQAWKLHEQLSKAEMALFRAHETAAVWFACTVMLLIITALLCAALALAT